VSDSLTRLEHDIVHCERCPRLRAHCQTVALEKRRAYADWDYWGRPVAGFGDPNARLYVLGLAPGAHGANRTGRVFTGDRSGDWLYRALHRAGFANQAESTDRDDGLRLTDCWVGAAGRCAPPGNRPTPEELAACRPYFERERQLLKRLQVVVALGRIAFDTWLAGRRPRPEFIHDGEYRFGPGDPVLISSYHPSQQNTSTGRLTEAMLDAVFQRVRTILE